MILYQASHITQEPIELEAWNIDSPYQLTLCRNLTFYLEEWENFSKKKKNGRNNDQTLYHIEIEALISCQEPNILKVQALNWKAYEWIYILYLAQIMDYFKSLHKFPFKHAMHDQGKFYERYDMED